MDKYKQAYINLSIEDQRILDKLDNVKTEKFHEDEYELYVLLNDATNLIYNLQVEIDDYEKERVQ